MPSWIGPWEIAIVVVIALLIFGPRKLPELGSSMGKSIRGFKKGLQEGKDELNEAMAEVKEATRDDAPVTRATTAEATAATSAEAAAAPSAEATSATATATAAPVADKRPRCWGTYEKDDESCMQCTVSGDCAQSGAEAPTAG